MDRVVSTSYPQPGFASRDRIVGLLGHTRQMKSKRYTHVQELKLTTDDRHQSKIETMLDELTDLVHQVEKSQPQNLKRLKFFVAMTKRLNLLEIYADEIEYIEEGAADDGAYATLDELRKTWRNQEMKRIKANLEKVHYQLQGVEAVSAVINGCRLEQVRPWSSLLLIRGSRILAGSYVPHTSAAPPSPEDCATRHATDRLGGRVSRYARKLGVLLRLSRQPHVEARGCMAPAASRRQDPSDDIRSRSF